MYKAFNKLTVGVQKNIGEMVSHTLYDLFNNSVTTIPAKGSRRAIDTHVERETPQQRLWQKIV